MYVASTIDTVVVIEKGAARAGVCAKQTHDSADVKQSFATRLIFIDIPQST